MGRPTASGEEMRALRDEWATHWTTFFQMSGGQAPPALPRGILDSWCRTVASAAPLTTRVAARLPADSEEGFVLSEAARHVEPSMRELSSESGYLIAIADAAATLIHVSAGREMLRRAEHVNAVPDSVWAEHVMGTNALALALRTGRPARVFATQHAAQQLHDWTCWAVPVHHRKTGALCGVVNIAAPWNHSSPMGTALARSVSLMAEDTMDRLGPSARREPRRLSVRLLGPVRVALRGTPVQLSPRQTEIVAILAMRPEGFSFDELHAHLYGDRRVAATTLRVELSKLRAILGDDLLVSRPYRLNAQVDLDLSRALAYLAAGDTRQVLDLFHGEPLPGSTSPYLREVCTHVCVSLRNRLLLTGCTGDALRYAEIFPWDDEVLRTAVDRAPQGDPNIPLLMGRLSAAASPAPTLRQHLRRTVGGQDGTVLSW
ncbi:hypothetical protein [Streptomyces chartreusis]|uniref:hypothetical protein n=1 Tax=Streptomyces chartreusis TaxID=1969 RepID=UPI003634BC98